MILSTVLSVLSNERILFFRLSELKIFICLSISILHCFSLRAGITGIPFGLFFTVRQPTVINELKRITDMDYRTLTSGGLLRLAREKGMSLPEQEAAYTEFSEQIFAVYTGGGSPRRFFARIPRRGFPRIRDRKRRFPRKFVFCSRCTRPFSLGP